MVGTQSAYDNVLKLKNRIKQLWIKLTDDEINCYEGQREVLLYVVQKKYDITKQQAENALLHMEEQKPQNFVSCTLDQMDLLYMHLFCI